MALCVDKEKVPKLCLQVLFKTCMVIHWEKEKTFSLKISFLMSEILVRELDMKFKYKSVQLIFIGI